MTMSCQSDHENKSKLHRDMPSPPHQIGGWEHTKQGIPHKNINIIGICGKHDQHWSPTLKIKEHKLAEVQRRGMKKVRLDGWHQRLGGAGFIRPGILVFACDSQVKHTAHHGFPCHPGHKGYSFLLEQTARGKGLMQAMLYPELWVRTTGFALQKSKGMLLLSKEVWENFPMTRENYLMYSKLNCFT